MKYFLPILLGGIAAFITGECIRMTGVEMTFDAWIVSLTLVGHDAGERMRIALSMIPHLPISDSMAGIGYLFGQSIFEEVVKFGAFLLAFRLLRPASIAQIGVCGVAVGIGFAAIESLIYYKGIGVYHGVIPFFIRSVGHGVFTGFVALHFSFGYFAQMRWIDSGAHGWLIARMVRYGEMTLIILLTVFGLILSTIFHAGTDVFIALGGYQIALVILSVTWMLFLYCIGNKIAHKPYGNLIRRVDLMETIRETNRDLAQIDKTDTIVRKKAPPQRQRRTVFVRTSLFKKKFAKT